MTNTVRSINFDIQLPPTDIFKPFDLTCSPRTDIWDKPPATHSFNAPFLFQSTTVSSFKSARVSVSADWKDRYDQGGLLVVVSLPEGHKWVKSGIEMENGHPNVGTVATEKWSDWSLLPIPTEKEATIELSVADDGSLWVSLIDKDGNKVGLREITWWITLPKDAECWVGLYAAKPAPNGETENLKVHFEGLEIVTT